MKNQNKLHSTVAIVLVLFCIFQLFRMWLSFLQRKPVENPLAPQYLETGVRNYVLFFTVIYLLVAFANVWSWANKKSFYAVTIVSFLVIVAIQLFASYIINFFLNHPLG